MASDESVKMVSSVKEDEFDDTDDGCHQNHRTSLSRLSVCSSSIYRNELHDDDDDDHDDVDVMLMSRLSLESFDGANDADGEVSDVEKDGKNQLMDLISSDSDKEHGCYSLPATPPRRKRRAVFPNGITVNNSSSKGEGYSSENAVRNGRKGNLRRQRKVVREKSNDQGSGGGRGGGVVVITRPKGGKRSLCMDLEEVKACRDLGFELEHERMMEVVPGQVSVSTGSGLETSSGGNSPIANWRISSPGDDPRDVKARLKVWAQAVALASASRHGS